MPGTDLKVSIETLVEEAVDLLPRIMSLVVREDQYQCRNLELSIPQLRLLRAVHERGEATMGGVSQALHVAPPAATMTADRLVGQGLIRRKEDPEDRRVVRLCLTPKGKGIMDRFIRAKKSRWLQIMKSLNETDRRSLMTALRQLYQLLVKAEGKSA